MTDDQFVEIPGKKFFERLSRFAPIDEGEPDIPRDPSRETCNTSQAFDEVYERLTLLKRMILD